MAKQLIGTQQKVLRKLGESGGTWYSGCGWAWGNSHRTENLLKSLVPRGLVAQVGTRNDYAIFELTQEGRSYLTP